MQPARVIATTRLSPTVKHLRLQLNEASKFLFKPGQWVDFTHPDLNNEVAGYSITSTPKLLIEKSQFDLAIQLTNHRVSMWVHDSCKVNDVVMVKVGGDFCLTEERVKKFKRLLLIAGGVGINPIYSMVRFVNDDESDRIAKIHLLYSSKSLEELLFKSNIENLCHTHSDKFSVQFFITKSQTIDENTNKTYFNRRIQTDDVKNSLERICCGPVNKDKLNEVGCFLCGPFVMVKDIEQVLMQYVDKGQIFYENWYVPESH